MALRTPETAITSTSSSLDGVATARTARRTSSAETRPPGTLVDRADRSTPRSRASRRTAGVAATPKPGLGVAATPKEGRGAAVAERGLGGDWPAASPPPPTPSVTENVTRTAPTGTSSPSEAPSETTSPAYGDGISTVAFAVSTSTNGWLSSTVSPTSTSQATIRPSSSPSPRSGNANTRSLISTSRSEARPRGCVRRWAGNAARAPPEGRACPTP